MNQMIQQNTASAEESAATSEELSSQAAELRNQLGRFVLKSSSGFNHSNPSTPQLPEHSSGW